MKPNDRFRSRMPAPPSAMPRMVRLLIGLAIVLIAMYYSWQQAQQRRQQPPAPPARGPVPVVVLPDKPSEKPGDAAAGDTAKKTSPDERLPRVRMEPERVVKTQIPNAVIRNQDGRVIFRGTVDLRETLDRIERGERNSHPNDGSVFQNRERRLPRKASGYYHEWVHPTPNQRGPGPQRIVTGEDGELYYTPDHYETFERLDSAAVRE